jgi:ATP-dependent RNA helicase DeaD
VVEELTASGLPAGFLHGDLAQATRARILEQFKKGRLRYMVATDVAARGIDISGLPLVVHLAIPTQMESYIHRSGRTGRAGAKGTSLALVNLKESRILSAWARRGGLELTWRTVPGPDELRAAKETHLRERIAKAADEAHRKDAKRLLGDTDAVEVVAGLLALLREDEPEGYVVPPVNSVAARKPYGSRDAAGPKRPWVPEEEFRAKRTAEGGDERPRRPWVPEEEWKAKRASEGRPADRHEGPRRPWIPDEEWQAKKAAGELPPRPKPGFKAGPKAAPRATGKPFAPKKRDK